MEQYLKTCMKCNEKTLHTIYNLHRKKGARLKCRNCLYISRRHIHVKILNEKYKVQIQEVNAKSPLLPDSKSKWNAHVDKMEKVSFKGNLFVVNVSISWGENGDMNIINYLVEMSREY